MHDHETCEQLMAAANRTGNYGRLEYLTARCDATHGREADRMTPTEEDSDVLLEIANHDQNGNRHG